MSFDWLNNVEMVRIESCSLRISATLSGLTLNGFETTDFKISSCKRISISSKSSTIIIAFYIHSSTTNHDTFSFKMEFDKTNEILQVFNSSNNFVGKICRKKRVLHKEYEIYNELDQLMLNAIGWRGGSINLQIPYSETVITNITRIKNTCISIPLPNAADLNLRVLLIGLGVILLCRKGLIGIHDGTS
eukprot:TRINITY_DN4432_c0_g1_i1.p1 TRINITY_DN4432_c0_g1~~TRINITY_DN4432_c0_g1_i1.p1  ORF type:complete len:189 (-),score=74.61 TRINITY_DN4432_c0_g1_i1:124-690(-)